MIRASVLKWGEWPIRKVKFVKGCKTCFHVSVSTKLQVCRDLQLSTEIVYLTIVSYFTRHSSTKIVEVKHGMRHIISVFCSDVDWGLPLTPALVPTWCHKFPLAWSLKNVGWYFEKQKHSVCMMLCKLQQFMFLRRKITIEECIYNVSWTSVALYLDACIVDVF